MAGRRGSGVLSVWAEMQRQDQRRREAEQRAQVAAQREFERRRRDSERAAARDRREAMRAYHLAREADVARATEDIERRVTELRQVLRSRLSRPAFDVEVMRRAPDVEPFAPGALAHPIPLPDPSLYQVPPPSPEQLAAPGAAQWYENERARLWERYRQDHAAARQAEAIRCERLAAYEAEYRAYVEQARAYAGHRDRHVDDLLRRVGLGERDAVEEWFTAVLTAAPPWPEGFPDEVEVAYDAAARQLVVDHVLPGFDIVPAVARVRYVRSEDRDAEVARSMAERREIHRDVIAQCALRLLAEIFRADRGALDSVVLNGLVEGVDPATGRPARLCLTTVTARAEAFASLALAGVHAVVCVETLGGKVSSRPDRPTVVRPGPRPGDVEDAPPPAPAPPAPARGAAGAGGAGGGTAAGTGDPDLLRMDPLEFERLVARLFEAMGLRVRTTARSGDEGVDVVAVDPDPVRGGTLVIQVKRYRHTVPPSAVRDLAGTVHHHGAIKGLLVTTSGFGPGSREFARGKPITLISGPELVDLLARHGLRGRLGPAPASRTAGAPASRLLVRLTWRQGAVPVDPVALVCAGARVLGDEHFVFFNNPASPEGAVRIGDQVSFLVDLDLLPRAADRLVLAAAVDEEAAPGRDLTVFQGMRVVLADQDSGREVAGHAVPRRMRGESGMVFGAFARRSGRWAFEPGTTGYGAGLLGLATAHGVQVE